MHVVAMIHHGGDGYGVSFPDFPGCTTVAKDLDSAVAKAGEVLAFHAEGLVEDGPLPRPRSLSELQSDPDFLEDAKDAALVLVPYEPPSRAVRINMTVEESLLARIDRAAEAAGETRSRYFATSARLRMGTSHDALLSRSTGSSLADVFADGIELVSPSVTRKTAHWKGYLKLSLVSCAISLYPASSSSERVLLRPINRKTGRQLRQQLVDAETGEPVAGENVGLGYKLGTNEYLPVEDNEFEKIQIESAHTIDITSFVPRGEIDIPNIESTYYVAPNSDVGEEAFAVIRDAMRSKDMLGIGRIVLGRRERPIALGALGKGLRAMTLRYPYELRSETEFFAHIPDIRVPNDMRKLAEHIIEAKLAKFDPSRFEDRYEVALSEMLRRKEAGVPTNPSVQSGPPSNVINLMDALRRSIKRERKRSGRRNAP
jgi:DNA end-binding protein Ku